jgi:hypothetical protein
MFREDFGPLSLGLLKVVVTRNGCDPRLLERVAIDADAVLGEVGFTVRLRDGREGSEVGSYWGLMAWDFESRHDRAMQLIAKAAGAAYGKPAPPAEVLPTQGWPGDGWWRETSQATAAAARKWVRKLIQDPLLTDARADLFIASLDPPKRTDLLRRAADGRGIAGF